MANGDAKTEAVRLDIRQTADMFDEEVELLKMAQLDSLAPIEAWTAIGTNMARLGILESFLRLLRRT